MTLGWEKKKHTEITTEYSVKKVSKIIHTVNTQSTNSRATDPTKNLKKKQIITISRIALVIVSVSVSVCNCDSKQLYNVLQTLNLMHSISNKDSK